MAINRLILGDNLEILKSMEKDCIDLIYIVYIVDNEYN
jgi:DNA modification methylase